MINSYQKKSFYLRVVCSVAVLILIPLIFAFGSVFAQGYSRVLFISSYHPGFPTFLQQVEGIKDIFQENDIRLDIEFMDTKRFSEKSNWDMFQSSLAYKLGRTEFYDVVMVADDNALVFALDQQAELFKGKPIVFLGVNNIDLALKQNNNPGITGVVESVSMKETIELMVEMQPQASNIVALVDGTSSGQGDLDLFYQLANEFPSHRFSDISLAAMTWMEFLDDLSILGDESAVLLLSAFRDKNNETLLFDESLNRIKGKLSIPIFHLWYHGIGDGVLGGKIISHYEQSKAAAKIVLEILKGAPVDQIRVVNESPNRYVFDYNQLKKNNLLEFKLPESCLVLNKPDSFYEENKSLVLGTILVFSILVIALFIAVINISRRKRVEQKLSKAQNYISNIIDSMPSMLIGVDTYGRVTQWNRTVEKVTGITNTVAHGKELSEVFPRIAPQMEKITESIRTRKTLREPKSSHLSDKGLCYEEVTIYPLVANGVEGAVLRIDDVTDKLRMEEMMIQNEKMLSVGGLAAGMAHEINNPIAGLIQTAYVMANRLGKKIDMPANLKAAEEAGTTMEAIQDFMEARGIPRMLMIIDESGHRIAQIVSNMLSFARQTDAQVSSHDFSELVDKTLDLAASDYNLKKKYDFKTIKLKKEYDANLPMVPCEGPKIQQVLLNILSNGAHAMQESMAKGKGKEPCFILRLSKEEDANMLRMEIEDNGPGMDKATLKRIFDPFFTTKSAGLGTGLGLSVSYFIITDNHHGTLDVVSEPGKGAIFIIRLPLNGKIMGNLSTS